MDMSFTVDIIDGSLADGHAFVKCVEEPVTVESLRRLNGTSVVDERGMPLPVYHGTFATFDRFTVTKDIGFHFGTLAAAERRRARAPLRPGNDKQKPSWRIITAFLDIKNPLILHVDPYAWQAWSLYQTLKPLLPDPVFIDLEAALTLSRQAWREKNDTIEALLDSAMTNYAPSEKHVERILKKSRNYISANNARRYACNQLIAIARKRTLKKLLAKRPDLICVNNDHEIIKSALKKAGYDGIAYINFFEAKNSISWVAFEDEQILKVSTGEAEMVAFADPRDLAISGYVPRTCPVQAPRPDVRTPNRDYLREKDIISLNAALLRQAKFNKKIVSYKRTVSPDWQKTVTAQFGCGQSVYSICVATTVSHKVPVTNENTGHTWTVEWPMYATATEAAAQLLDSIVAVENTK